MRAALAVLLSAPVSAAGQDRILSWPETVQIEHEDRLTRLRSLAMRSLGTVPRIDTYRIDRSALPRSIPVDIPISRWVFDQRVFFDTDSDVLRPEGQAVIEVVAEVLRGEAADTAVFVAGHTDSRADDGYNYALSVRRARSVALALHARRVRQAQIWQVGFGEAIPLAPNTSEAGMARNRRVEFLFGRRPSASGCRASATSSARERTRRSGRSASTPSSACRASSPHRSSRPPRSRRPRCRPPRSPGHRW